MPKERARQSWWDKPSEAIFTASILFAFAQATFRGRTNDVELLFLSFLDWCLLVLISSVPLAGIYVLIDRSLPLQRLIGQGSDTRRWIVAGLAAVACIPLWQLIWVAIVMPLETSAPWIGVLGWLGVSGVFVFMQERDKTKAKAKGQPQAKAAWRPTIGGVLLLALAVFVIARMFFPPFPAWLASGARTTPDGTPLMLGLVALLAWATLVAIAVLPVIFVVHRLNRAWPMSFLNKVGGERARYLGKMVLSLALSVPVWLLAWDHVVAPLWTSAVGHLAGTMFSTLAVVVLLAVVVCFALALPAAKEQP